MNEEDAIVIIDNDIKPLSDGLEFVPDTSPDWEELLNFSELKIK